MRPQFIEQQFADSYRAIKQHTAGLSHDASLWQPPNDGNCINWILGHVIVSRCNFLTLLDVPSIWGMEQCRRFMPGSPPVTGQADSIPLAALLADLERTQKQLCDALARISPEDLKEVRGDRSVGESLLYYQAHESWHAGQIEVLSQIWLASLAKQAGDHGRCK